MAPHSPPLARTVTEPWPRSTPQAGAAHGCTRGRPQDNTRPDMPECWRPRPIGAPNRNGNPVRVPKPSRDAARPAKPADSARDRNGNPGRVPNPSRDAARPAKPADSARDRNGNPGRVPKPSRDAARPAKPADSARDHSARARRPICKCRPSATAHEHSHSTCVHQAVQAAAFWKKVSLHQMGRASTSDLRVDPGPVSCVRGPHEIARSGP